MTGREEAAHDGDVDSEHHGALRALEAKLNYAPRRPQDFGRDLRGLEPVDVLPIDPHERVAQSELACLVGGPACEQPVDHQLALLRDAQHQAASAVLQRAVLPTCGA
eukprot:CAMPEP_0180262772 /NCGR_PEP_ID=MMETSP0987-20121128/44912_1 /TAXON_ID=697907 /ORGANISM="non described non described, Strain CCMP2293" /LENGTH=106 /DNA_ID=CAMNT_0022232929 /DNA_START=30 /DNA_END=351 /DNA_ORIENTATION=-